VQDDARNPYSPPSAPLSPEEPELPVPPILKGGAWLYGVAYILFYFLMPPVRTVAVKMDMPAGDPEAAARIANEAGMWSTYVGLALLIAVFAGPFWLLYKALRRRSWARTTLALFTAALLLICLEFARVWSSGSIEHWAIWLTDAALELVALALFFTPTASRWYRAATRRM
jgi:hypothetical protein